MLAAPLTNDEKSRLDTLRYYQILDTLPEKDFDDLTKIAAYIFETPIALISLVDERRQWFKSHHGLEASETPRNLAFCAHAILGHDVFVVADSHADERFFDNPLVTGAPYVRFYAGAPLITPDGHKLGTICVIDQSPKEMSDEQKEMLKSLARQVVNQMQLRLKFIEAQKENKVKASFLANMSHEIRTPLNGILGCAHILVDSLQNEEHKKLASTIAGCGDGLLALINDILDFSKLEAGKMPVLVRPFKLREEIAQLEELFRPLAQAQNLKLSFHLLNEIPSWVEGDVHRLRQILSNLLSNAIKFTPNGTVRLELGCEKRNQNLYLFSFVVKDSGIGMDAAAMRRLFVSFSQVDGSMAKNYGGTGLGLAICKALSELMGGKISVESELGKGSTFTLSLELKEITAPAAQNSTGLAGHQLLASEHPLRILLAEDNEINQVVARKALAKLGYEVDVASTGEEALKCLERTPYDLVLMDCFMPGLDGFEATKLIKRDPERYHHPRVVALTASALSEDREKCTAAGMDDFLSKPLNSKEISRVLLSTPMRAAKSCLP